MEIELNLKTEITELLPNISKEKQKNNIEISDFIMIIDDLINQNIKQTETKPKKELSTQIENIANHMINDNEEIFSEFEFQMITQETNKETKKIESSKTSKAVGKIEISELNTKEILMDLSTQNIQKNQEEFIVKMNKEEIFQKNKTDIKEVLIESSKIKRNEENLEQLNLKEQQKNSDKNIINTKPKIEINFSKEENNLEKLNIKNEENKQQYQSTQQLQNKNQQILNQKIAKEIEAQPNIFKKDEKNQVKDDFITLNAKNDEKEQKYEKTQETNMKTTPKEIPEQRLERKKIEINDERIGKIKMIFNSNSKEMDIKITTHDKEIFRNINEVKNQIANEITKNAEIERTSIKINLDDENQNPKKQNQYNNKKNKKLSKQKKESFEVV